jgi:hypothetical protein
LRILVIFIISSVIFYPYLTLCQEISVIVCMAQQYSFDNIQQLSHSNGQVNFIYDRNQDVYRPLEQKDMSMVNAESQTNFDAFGRLRTSQPLTMFDSSHRFADNNLWNTLSGTGGAVAFNSGQGLMELSATNASGSTVMRETTKVFAYQPGKSLLTLNTFVMSSAKDNLVQKVGYFGTNNGMYLELNNSILNFVERTSVVGATVTETRVNQANWNGDKLDGTGASKLTLDMTKAQILWMDIEWLGVGSVRMGFVINGKFILCHSFHHANIINSTYITSASLPLRYEIYNTAATTGANTLKQICSSVISEGGYELRGVQQAVSVPINAARTLGTIGVKYPVISIRLKSTRLDAIVILTALSMMGDTAGKFNWSVVASGVTTGGTWQSAGASSAVEYKLDGVSFSGGRTLASGYFTSTSTVSTNLDILKEALFKFQLERNNFTGEAFELTLVLASDSSNDRVFGSMDWEEISR